MPAAALARLDADRRALEAAYTQRTPNSRDQFARAAAVLPGGNTRSNLYFAPYSPAIAHADGTTLTDIDGQCYVDFLNDYTVAVNGHAHPRIRAALGNVLHQGWSFGGRTQQETALGEAIRSRFPAMQRLRFVNSGTEASLYAVLLARQHTQRSALLVIDGGYHGGTLSFTEAAPRLNVPFDVERVSYNDPAALERALAAAPGRYAAVLLELMLNSGGCIPASREFAATAARAARDHGALLIVDEVMTARLAWGGLQSTLGVHGDLVVLGKIIGGGLPCGAFGGRTDVMAALDATQPGALVHNGSFNNNVFTMHAGHVALTEVLTAEAMQSMNVRGDALRRALDAVFARADVPLCLSGIGSVMVLHTGRTPPVRFVRDPAADAVRALLHLYLLQQGFWIGRRGQIALSILTRDEDCARLTETVGAFAQRYADALRAIA
jgi:glutamate-1-semialdehyde 2,1-aminomutase